MKSVIEHIKSYVNKHLNQPITLNDIASEIGYSKFYTSRIFKEVTGLSLFEYIRSERLLASAFTLRNSDERILDIAFDFVFDSHEGFTRAFTNGFGITPKKFSTYPNPEGWLIPYYYLNRQNQETEKKFMNQKTAVIFTQIMERPARKLILSEVKRQQIILNTAKKWAAVQKIRQILGVFCVELKKRSMNLWEFGCPNQCVPMELVSTLMLLRSLWIILAKYLKILILLTLNLVSI